MNIDPRLHLYLIGGGYPKDPRMSDHYQRIVQIVKDKISSDRVPCVAIMPTAQRNGKNAETKSFDFLQQEFERLGCNCSFIFLGEVPEGVTTTSPNSVAEILQSIDALYVPGGDTRYMLQVIRDLMLAPMFFEAFERGLFCAGSSAGTIWLAAESMSDSASYTTPTDWQYITLEGLGVLPFAVNVHDDQGLAKGERSQKSRKEIFEEKFISSKYSQALAIDEFTAIEFKQGQYIIHSPDGKKGVARLLKRAGEIERKKLNES